jgi:hypothetical protein
MAQNQKSTSPRGTRGRVVLNSSFDILEENERTLKFSNQGFETE